MNYLKLNNNYQKRAFSIIELSICLILLSIIATMTLSASSIIQKAGLLKTIEAIARLESHINTFVSSYNQIPGDMSNATSYWSLGNFQNFCDYRDSAGNALAITEGFNGNGDGYIDIEKNNTDSKNHFTEATAFFCHLRLANILDYKPTVIKLNSNTLSYDGKLQGWYFPTGRDGVNIIIGRILSKWEKYRYIFPNDKTHELIMVGSNLDTDWSAKFSIKEAALLDGKIDDGMPGAGQVRCSGITTECCDNSTAAKECVSNSAYYNRNKKGIVLSKSILIKI